MIYITDLRDAKPGVLMEYKNKLYRVVDTILHFDEATKKWIKRITFINHRSSFPITILHKITIEMN